ncbi:hypothetical protein HHI36_014710 [Cryptolaemus montrouzieri]|uniref:Uncharacterized protein n=1 Tax=Cryptolaemus montrouzieri TaxID=559131 RepID=A0ABD2N3I4_9CUCU
MNTGDKMPKQNTYYAGVVSRAGTAGTSNQKIMEPQPQNKNHVREFCGSDTRSTAVVVNIDVSDGTGSATNLKLNHENDTEINKFNKYKSNVGNTEQEGDWKTVSYRNKLRFSRENKKPKILCNRSKTTGKESTIQGAKKRFWLYVGKIQGKDTREDDIKSWMSDVEGTDEIIVEKLTTIGQNSAFSIGLPSDSAF